jgi:hypothetical protein
MKWQRIFIGFAPADFRFVALAFDQDLSDASQDWTTLPYVSPTVHPASIHGKTA